MAGIKDNHAFTRLSLVRQGQDIRQRHSFVVYFGIGCNDEATQVILCTMTREVEESDICLVVIAKQFAQSSSKG